MFNMAEEKVRVEEFTLSGGELIEKVKELVKAGNVRKLIIKTSSGKTIIEVPLTLGVVGGAALTAIAPALIAIGAIAGFLTRCTLVIEKVEK